MRAYTAILIPILLVTTELIADPAGPAEKKAWELSAGVFLGSCNPDLEQKYKDDTAYGAAYAFGGFGYQTGWTGKDCGGHPLEIRYNAERFSLTGEFTSSYSTPSYNRVIQGNSSGYSLSVIEEDHVKRRARIGFSVLGEIPLTSDSDDGFALAGGLRSMKVNTKTDRRSLITIAGASSTAVTLATQPGVSVLESGVGPAFGFSYRTRISESLLLNARFLIFNMYGDWQQQQIQVDAGQTSGGFIRNENGKYHMPGEELVFGLAKSLSSIPGLSLYARIRSEVSYNRDSSVRVSRFGIGAEAQTDSQIIQDMALTYGGSRDVEKTSGLEFGVIWRFH